MHDLKTMHKPQGIIIFVHINCLKTILERRLSMIFGILAPPTGRPLDK